MEQKGTKPGNPRVLGILVPIAHPLPLHYLLGPMQSHVMKKLTKYCARF